LVAVWIESCDVEDFAIESRPKGPNMRCMGRFLLFKNSYYSQVPLMGVLNRVSAANCFPGEIYQILKAQFVSLYVCKRAKTISAQNEAVNVFLVLLLKKISKYIEDVIAKVQSPLCRAYV
jgi:hypothetical protein